VPATKVYLVAEMEALRIGLGAVIKAQPDMTVAGAAQSLERMARDDAFRTSDVILVHVPALNQSNVEDVYRQLGEWLPGMRILFFGSERDARGMNPAHLPQHLSLNTVGFLLMDAPAERLVDCVRLVASGCFVCQCDMSFAREALVALGLGPAREEAGQEDLSERELDVLRLVAEGLSNRQVAEQLFLTEGTVKIHVSHIMNKLAVERRTELVRYALSRGLVPLES